MTALRLNGWDVPAQLEALMRRPDWAGKRTSDSWLARFGRPSSGFIEFCGIDHLKRENLAVIEPQNAILNGLPNAENPPGDFDPKAGFLIGFTDHVDAAICVDFRPDGRPRIIYDSPSHPQALFLTAFASLDEFCRYYREQHGDG